MAGALTPPVPKVIDYPVYGAVYDGDVSFATVEVVGGGLDIEGVAGDDLEFGLFFDYTQMTGYTFSGFVVITPSPLQRVIPIAVTVLDPTVGLFTVKLSAADTLKIGPVSGKPWFLRAIDPLGKQRTVLMGKLSLNRY
jgi:hypothetical protein